MCACKVLELGGSATSYSQVALSPVPWQKDTVTQSCLFTSSSQTRHGGGEALNNYNCRVAIATILASKLRRQK